jgi:peptidoglycan/xylan/chitin deacetylase (PgdA/CDA1 family)
LSEVLVVCYHAVSPSWDWPYSIPPARLQAQIASLLRRGYLPATLSEAIASPPGERTLVVTFDDALSSVHRHGLPALRALGVPATVFACTAWAGRDEPMRIGADRWIAGPHERELVSLDWDELAVLRDVGWQIGSHTRTHPRLTRLADTELRQELAVSKSEIEERLGAECSALAYPHGDADERVVAAARAAGYAIACLAAAGAGAPDALRWPRSLVLREDGRARFRVKTSLMARRLRGSRTAWKLLSPGHRALGGRRRGERA